MDEKKKDNVVYLFGEQDSHKQRTKAEAQAKLAEVLMLMIEVDHSLRGTLGLLSSAKSHLEKASIDD